jgi:hypothetical protein
MCHVAIFTILKTSQEMNNPPMLEMQDDPVQGRTETEAVGISGISYHIIIL